MNLLFLKQPEGFIYYDEVQSVEDTFPTDLVNLLDEWEDLIKIRQKHKQFITLKKGNVFFIKLNIKYHRALREEMKIYCSLCDFIPEYKVFAERRELTLT